MDEKRKGEIAYQINKLTLRREFSLRDIAGAKRRIGNLVKEPELAKANISQEELLDYGKLIVREVFEEQMAGL